MKTSSQVMRRILLGLIFRQPAFVALLDVVPGTVRYDGGDEGLRNHRDHDRTPSCSVG